MTPVNQTKFGKGTGNCLQIAQIMALTLEKQVPKSVKIKIYKFNELSDKAKDRARHNRIWPWGDDYIKALKQFVLYFGCKLVDYNIDWASKYYSNVFISEFNNTDPYDVPYDIEYVEEGCSLKFSYEKWLKNKIDSYNQGQFSGFFVDDIMFNGLTAEYNKGERDLQKLVLSGYDEWFNSANIDYEEYHSDEYIGNESEEADLWYYDNGELFSLL